MTDTTISDGEPDRSEAGRPAGGSDPTTLEQRLRVALAPLDIAVFQQDLELRYTWIYRPQLGYAQDEVIGKTDFELLPREAAEAAGQVKREAMTNGAIVRREVRVDSPEGELIYDLVAEPLRDADGRIVGITGASLDITERKRMEETVRAGERRFKAVFDLAPIGISLVDGERHVTDINPALARIAQVEPGPEAEAAFRNRRYIRRDGTPMPPETWPSSVALRERRTEKDVEIGIVVNDRDVRWVQVSATPLELPDTRAVVITQDITERRRAEEALRATEERLRLTLEATRDGIWDWNVRTGLAYLSPRYYEVTGYRADEVTADFAFFRRLVHPDDFPGAWKAMEDHLAGRTDQSVFDFRLIRKDGSLAWMLGRGRVVERDATGAAIRMVGTISSIDDRKGTEARLTASRAALRALTARMNAAREEERVRIARAVHDDLGHAFADLKLDLAWLDRRLDEHGLDRRSAPRRRIAEMSARAAEHLGVVRRIAADLRPAVLDAFGLPEAIEWAARQFESRTRIPCSLELDPLPASPDDRRVTALFRIFQEILSNVARHAGASSVRVSLTATAESAVLSVADDGRGITAAEAADPLSMGLLGMRERAMEHGGAVAIEGVAGAGTTVTVTLPWSRT